MKPLKSFIIFLPLTLGLMGCEREQKVHDVQYYYEHFEECKKQVEKCQNNPAQLKETPHCRNALAAYHKRLMTGDGTGKMPEIRLK